MAADPTRQTLADLADPGKYVRLDGVPVLAPFNRGDAAVTAADLPAICERMQARDRAGNAVTLTHGHIKPAADEKDQPQLLGLYRNPRLGTLQDGTPAILMDRFVFREDAERVRKLPHRSSEYYPRAGVVRGVAALVRPPEIDMGVVCLEGQERPVCLSLGDEPMSAPAAVRTALDTVARFAARTGGLVNPATMAPYRPGEAPSTDANEALSALHTLSLHLTGGPAVIRLRHDGETPVMLAAEENVRAAGGVPAGHDAAMRLMLANPGMSYAAALRRAG